MSDVNTSDKPEKKLMEHEDYVKKAELEMYADKTPWEDDGIAAKKENLQEDQNRLLREKGIKSIQGEMEDADGKTAQEFDETPTDAKATPDIMHAEDEVRPEAVEPNAVYERNGYEYKTDELGRTKLVTGDLALEEGERSSLQTEVGHMGLDGDEGGHLIGTRFNGPTDAFNLVPQDANLNRGEWKSMENSWAEKVKNGQDVKVMIEPAYGDDSIRPESFEVLSQVDNELTYTSYLNQPGNETKGE